MKIIKVLGEELRLQLSPSFLQKAVCGQYLKFRYVDKQDDRYVRVAAMRGRAAHEAIAELTDICLEEGIQPVELEDQNLEEALRTSTPHEILSEVGPMFAWLQLWRDRFRIDISHYHGHEEKIALNEEFDECDWSEASYRGVIDYTETSRHTCVVTDYKSQPKIEAQSDLDDIMGNDVAEQLTMYCWILWKLYPHLTKFRARIWYLRYGFYDETIRTEEDLEAYEHVLMLKERKLAERDNWDPVPGKHCQYCDYIHRCPLATDLGPENTEIISQEQAVQAAERITVMESLTKELKSKLKTYVNANDNVRTSDDWVYGFHPKKSIYYDPVKLAETLEDHGFDFAKVANPDGRKLKKLLKELTKRDPALAAAIEDLQKERIRTQFEGYLPKKG